MAANLEMARSDKIRVEIFRSQMIGSKLAHYEITAHLGSDGMGDVYQATDTKLGRSVAIKFLPEAISHDGERRRDVCRSE
jgi:serine/threonine protein kinase